MEHPNVQSGDSRAALSSKLGSLLNRDRLRVELRATLLDLRSRSSTLQRLLSFEIHRTVVALKQRFWPVAQRFQMSMMRLWSWQPASMEPRMGRPNLGGKGVCERSESGHSFRGFRSWVISSSRATKKRATFGVSAAINARTCTTQQYFHLRKKNMPVVGLLFL